MKKGEFITLCILRLIAIAIGIIHLFTKSKMWFSICVLLCALILIIDTIVYIRRYEGGIKWLFKLPLITLPPIVSFGFIAWIVDAIFFDRALGALGEILIGVLIVCVWNLFASSARHQKEKREEAARQRYYDYYDDRHDNYRY